MRAPARHTLAASTRALGPIIERVSKSQTAIRLLAGRGAAMRPECRVASPPAGTQCSAPGTLRLRSWARTEAASIGAAVGLWTCTGTALGQALHTSGCFGVDACAKDARGWASSPGLGLIFSRIGESQISVRQISHRLVAHCNIAPAADGAGVTYRLIIDASLANEMHSDWDVSYTAGAQLSGTLNRCNLTPSVKCWHRGRRLSSFP